MKYDTSLTWNRLQSDPEALALVKQYLPEMEQMIKDYPNAARISIAAASRYAPQLFTPEKINALQTALTEYGKTHGLTPEEQTKLEKYRRMASVERPYSGLGKQPEAVAFYPGRPWADTDGKRIQAHAGAIYYENGMYYWYGENKEFTDGACGIWTWGIRAYRSKDLYNWEDLGLLVAPNLEDPDDNLFPEKCVDRPHILKCPKTGKYLLWLKISGAESCFTILQADALLGPYTVLRQNYHPLGHHVGDFDMVADEKSGIGYLYMDTDHDRIAGFRLTEDYTAVETEISSQYEGLKTPFRREGIALFEHDGKKYMITSGMSGYTPNQSDAAVADSWEGPFVSIGDPHVDDESMASFNSQISQVFELPNQKQYAQGNVKASLNHYSYGAVIGSFFAAAGIHITPQGAEITPHILKAMQFARCSYMSRYGKIESSWQLVGNDTAELEISIPTNCKATLHIQDKTIAAEPGVHRFTISV